MNRLHIKPRRPGGERGFTLVEVTMAALIIAFVAAGVWGVYWSVVNTYYVEQRDTNIQAEGDRLIEMIANGGYAEGRRVYGLGSMVQVQSGLTKYPNVGKVTSHNFKDWDDISDDIACEPKDRMDYPDYRIEFILDSVSGNTRYAEFAVQLYACDPLDPEYHSKSILLFRHRMDGKTGTDNEFNYQVILTENMLQRTDSEECKGEDEYELTWFKAQLLPKDPGTGLYTGIKVSFYLNDTSQTVNYNCNLYRDLSSYASTGNPDQDRTLMGAIPYPRYFSTTIYFPKGG